MNEQHRLTHGGDVYTIERDWLDFSINVNPLGMPECVRQAALDSLDQCERYPDPLNRRLRERLSQLENCPVEMIVCGNGASDLIYRIVQAVRPRRAMVLAPTFSEYALALKQSACEIVDYPLRESQDFKLDEAILSAILPGLDTLFLCNPNNPNGWPIPHRLLQQILERCNRTKTLLVVDECFIDLLPDPAEYSLVPQVPENPRLVVLKAMTKTYAMPGIRLGYLLGSDKTLLEQIWQAGPPWNVSTVASACAIAAADCQDYVVQSRHLVQKQRFDLSQALTAMGMKVYPSEANYVLFSCSDPDLHCKLKAQGILIRDCSNYSTLGSGFFRIAVRRAEEQEQLIHAMIQIQEGQASDTFAHDPGNRIQRRKKHDRYRLVQDF